MEDFGSTDDILPMYTDSNVSSLICFVIAILTAGSEDIVKDLLGSNMSFDFGESDGSRTFSNGSFCKVLPKVTIRRRLPIMFYCLVVSEFVQDIAARVKKSLAICANVNRAIGNKGNYGSSELGSCGDAIITPYGGE